MNTSRKGKIARLPKSVREQLNRRLADGESGPALVRWLNKLPEVQAVVAGEFENRPVREQNLTEWRAGGYRDWQRQQEALEWARGLSEEAQELAGQTGSGTLADHLSTVAALVIGRTLQSLANHATGSAEERKELLGLCQELAKLRRGDHELEWLRLEREVVALRQRESAENREKEFLEWARDPKNETRIRGSALTEDEKQARIRSIFGMGSTQAPSLNGGGDAQGFGDRSQNGARDGNP